MKMRSKRTLETYGLSEEQFQALYDAQNGCCAICGISESDLDERYSGPEYWASDRQLHIDHEHGSSPPRVRGLLCFTCNYDLEAFVRNAVVTHPKGRGRSAPRDDPRFLTYLGEGWKRPRKSATKRTAQSGRFWWESYAPKP
jgi:hypothetical protein